MHHNKPFTTPGTLNERRGQGGNGLETTQTPLKLQLPAPTRVIR